MTVRSQDPSFQLYVSLELAFGPQKKRGRFPLSGGQQTAKEQREKGADLDAGQGAELLGHHVETE